MVTAEMDADRELLLAALRRHADAVPTRTLGAIAAAADELLDPLELPALVAVPDESTADLPAVVHAVRARLAAAAAGGGAPGQALACSRAARELAAAEHELAGGRPAAR